jgi:hypothetical protein
MFAIPITLILTKLEPVALLFVPTVSIGPVYKMIKFYAFATKAISHIINVDCKHLYKIFTIKSY